MIEELAVTVGGGENAGKLLHGPHFRRVKIGA